MMPSPTSATWIASTPSQYTLWIDGVGGFLVCLQNRLTFGQPAAARQADVPIFADLGRHHATLHRESEGYFLEAVRKTQVNGQMVEKTWLRSGDRITLGAVCQMRFTQTAAVSASARLDLESGHRWLRPVEAILLMAETIVVGSALTSHVLTVSTKGWVVIPAEMRKKYSLAPGSAVTIVDYGGVLALVPRLADPIQQARGLLAGATSLTQALLHERQQERLRER